MLNIQESLREKFGDCFPSWAGLAEEATTTISITFDSVLAIITTLFILQLPGY